VVYARYSSTGHYRAEIEAGASFGTLYKRVGSKNTTLGTFSAAGDTNARNFYMEVRGTDVIVGTAPQGQLVLAPVVASGGGVTAAGTNRISLTRVAGTSSVTIDNWEQYDRTNPTALASYTYNADGQIVNEALPGGSRSYAYTNGRRTGFNETLPGAARATTLTYDTTGRIATETTGTITTTYGYDPASQLLSVTPTTGSATTYTYDPLGRRSSEKIGTAAATRYVYDAAGQLCWTTTKTLPTSPSCASPLSGAATFAWDAAGRLTNETRAATNKVDYTYDPAGRLTTIARLNGTVVTTQSRAYTADGMLAQTSNTVGAATSTSQYTWDPTISQVPQLSSIETAGATWNLAYGASGWASIHSGAVLNPVAIATDVHGSVIASTGNTLARNSAYTAYGTPSGTNTFEPRLGYRGELTLDNQLWLRARTYQPSLGLMTSRDPAQGQAGTATIAGPYHYADNNPPNRADPTGKSTQGDVSGQQIGTTTGVGSRQSATGGVDAAFFPNLNAQGSVGAVCTGSYNEYGPCYTAKELIDSGRLRPLEAQFHGGEYYTSFQLSGGIRSNVGSEITNYSWHDEFFETTDIAVPGGFVDYNKYEYQFVQGIQVVQRGYTYPDEEGFPSREGQSAVNGILRIKRTTQHASVTLGLPGSKRTVDNPAPSDPMLPTDFTIGAGGSEVNDVDFYPIGPGSPWMPIIPSVADSSGVIFIRPFKSGFSFGE
jgi:RHS repeat-associated protein